MDLRSVYPSSGPNSTMSSSISFAVHITGNIGAPLEEYSNAPVDNGVESAPGLDVFSDDPLSEGLVSEAENALLTNPSPFPNDTP